MTTPEKHANSTLVDLVDLTAVEIEMQGGWFAAIFFLLASVAESSDVQNGLYRYDKWRSLKTDQLKEDDVFRQPKGHSVHSCVMLCQVSDSGCQAFVYDEVTGVCTTYEVAPGDHVINPAEFPGSQSLYVNSSVPIPDLFPENRAYNMSVHASSENLTSLAKSVDGNIQEKNLFSTKHQDARPWWVVDLGRRYRVLSFKIYINKDFPRRLHNFEIRVGDTPVEGPEDPPKNRLCVFYPGTPHFHNNVKEDSLSDRCRRFGMPGQFVSVQIVQDADKETLQLQKLTNYKNVVTFREFQVYGFEED